jgi:hypothetical protein
MTLGGIIISILAVGIFVWLLLPAPGRKTPAGQTEDDSFIDPDDSRQIGMLIGLTGGTIPDAAAMRFALGRFQEIHGRRATSRDIGTVLGLIESGK